ncbi:MAG: M20 family metallopeptidase [Candidatus Dormibacteraceae bacterium]
MATAKEQLEHLVDADRDDLVELSHRIHAGPELAFEERHSSEMVADHLARHGFRVETGAGGLETAFSATAGSGPLTVAICCEYDALPGIGHACGHNIIATAGAGAGAALAPLADDLGITVRVLGTPAEEAGGGKIWMLDRGAFDGAHAALMVHPSPLESDSMDALAVDHFRVTFSGRSSHASAFPQLGLNAGDAMTIAQVAIGLLRQQFNPWDQVHGIVTRGGDAPNVIPAETIAEYYVRADSMEKLSALRKRVNLCFEAGALASGTQVAMKSGSAPYSGFAPDLEMAALYRANAEAIGREFSPGPGMKGGSTDMANVSLRMPTIHPMIAIESKGAVNHQPEFTAACVTPSADRAVRDGALALALTVADLAAGPALRRRLLETDTMHSKKNQETAGLEAPVAD